MHGINARKKALCQFDAQIISQGVFNLLENC